MNPSAEPPARAGKSRLWLWAKRLLAGLVIILGVLILAGLIYQAIGERADRRSLQPPGEMVDAGGFNIHIHCQGEGEPTVILDALSGGSSSYWAWVQPELAKITRVCAYDRAGRGWSEDRPAIEGNYAEQTARELHTVLENAGIPGPYVLTGHSIGGIHARVFADLYPESVVGLALVDAAHPEQQERIPEIVAETEAFMQQSALFPAFARLGLFRLFFDMGGELDFQDLPPQQHAEVAALWSSPRYFASQRAESLAAGDVFARGQSLGDLGDLPLVVVTAGIQQFPGWYDLQDELAALSSNSAHVTIPEATHASLAFNPEHASQLSKAIGRLIQAVRSGNPLATP